MLGVKEEGREYGLPYKEYSAIKLMITHIGFPKHYLDDLTTIDLVREEKAQALDLQFEPSVPKYKDGGLAVELTIIEVNGEAVNDTNFITINQLPPTKVWEKSKEFYGKGYAFGYSNQYNGLSSKKTRQGRGQVIKLHPNPNVEKDWKANVTATSIPAGCEDSYIDLIRKEKERYESWENLCKLWNELDELSCYADISEGIARRLCLARPTADGNNYEFLNPEVGMIVEARLKPGKGRYWTPECFTWNQNGGKNGYWEMFSSINTTPVTEADKQEAMRLHLAIMDKKQKAADAKAQEESGDNVDLQADDGEAF